MLRPSKIPWDDHLTTFGLGCAPSPRLAGPSRADCRSFRIKGWPSPFNIPIASGCFEEGGERRTRADSTMNGPRSLRESGDTATGFGGLLPALRRIHFRPKPRSCLSANADLLDRGQYPATLFGWHDTEAVARRIFT